MTREKIPRLLELGGFRIQFDGAGRIEALADGSAIDLQRSGRLVEALFDEVMALGADLDETRAALEREAARSAELLRSWQADVDSAKRANLRAEQLARELERAHALEPTPTLPAPAPMGEAERIAWAKLREGMEERRPGFVDVRFSPSEKPVQPSCLECSGTGWFSPTPVMADGWNCGACGGTGIAGNAPKPALLSPPPTPQHWVRCRDGALYQNPVWIFEGGYAHVAPDLERLEVVFWVGASLRGWSRAGFADYLFGLSINQATASLENEVLRSVPGIVPERLELAHVFQADISRRLPRPTEYVGDTARYSARVLGAVLDFPAGYNDAAQLDLPVLPPATEPEEPKADA